MSNLRAPQTDELTRCRAAQYLGDYGQLGVGPFSDLERSVIDVLETTLADRRDNARLCAFGALLKFARRNSSIADIIEKQLNDSDERFRLHAMLSLNELGLRSSQEAFTVLLAGAASPDKVVRRDALAWLIAIDKSQVDPSQIIAELEAIKGRFPQLADEIEPTLMVIRANHMPPNSP
jgi:HEAT repeat protein